MMHLTLIDTTWWCPMEKLGAILLSSFVASVGVIGFIVLFVSMPWRKVSIWSVFTSIPIVCLETGISSFVFLQGMASVSKLIQDKPSSHNLSFSNCANCPDSISCRLPSSLSHQQKSQLGISFAIAGGLLLCNIVSSIVLTLSLQLSQKPTNSKFWKVVYKIPKFICGKLFTIVASMFANQYAYVLAVPAAIISSVYHTTLPKLSIVYAPFILWACIYYMIVFASVSPQALLLSIVRYFRFLAVTEKKSRAIVNAPLIGLLVCMWHNFVLSLGMPDKWVSFEQRKLVQHKANYATVEFFSGYLSSFLMCIPFIGPFFYLFTTALSKSSYWLHNHWNKETTPAVVEPSEEEASTESTESASLLDKQQIQQPAKKSRWSRFGFAIEADAQLSDREKVQKILLILTIPLIGLLVHLFPHGIDFKEILLCKGFHKCH
jgi:hypothetical protein